MGFLNSGYIVVTNFALMPGEPGSCWEPRLSQLLQDLFNSNWRICLGEIKDPKKAIEGYP